MMQEEIRRSLEYDFIISGIGMQNSYEGDFLSLSSAEVEYHGQILKNCLHLKYHIDVVQDISLTEQEFINRIVVKEGDIFLQVLALVFARPSHIFFHQAKLDGEVIEPEFPTQKIPSGLYNMISLWKRPNTNYRYVSVLHDDGWPLLELLAQKFRQKPPAFYLEVALPLRWFLKGSNETNSLDRLVAFWICFNALYENPKLRERKAIEQFIVGNMDHVIAQRYIAQNKKRLLSLSKFPIELRGEVKIAEELKDSISSSPIDYQITMKNIALTIYGVRNRLFHGDCDPDSSDDRSMIELSERLLSILMQEVISKKILGYPLPHRRFVVQEKFGF